MSLWPVELELVAAEVDRELKMAVVQRVHAPTTSRVYLETRVPGRSVTLLLCSEAQVARISAVEERPPNPPTPPAWQSVLRRELVGAALEAVEADPRRRLAVLHLRGREEVRRRLVLELGSPAGIVLATDEGRVLALSSPPREGLRVGGTWIAPEPGPLKDVPSRLAGAHAFLRPTRAAEALFARAEEKRAVDTRKAPLMTKLKRLERTKEKVRAEADRGAKAGQLQQEGELLKGSLGRLVRGATSITVDAYQPDGAVVPVTIALDPRRTPLEEVDWRFKQSKRLTRGAELARARLQVLEEEERRLRLELARAEMAPVDRTLPAPAPAPRASQGPSAALPPYREYRGAGGQRLWVGRGAVHNDALTFHVARPFHVWFHARGVPGAHVVVPLEKSTQLQQEVMLDAAHLALFHSDAKGEPRGEVSYTQVKFVRRGAAPGAVTYTREKTILLKVESERLRRLLGSADPE